jgi:hypothetical protein
VFCPESGAQCFQAIEAPGDEDEVRTPGGELAGVFRPQAGRGASDKGCPEGYPRHRFSGR